MDNLEATLKKRDENILKLQHEIKGLVDDKVELGSQVTILKEKLMNGERVRKYLHNKIQTLKGNIRVFCRVRPILKTDGSAITCFTYPQSYDDKECITLLGHTSATSLNGSVEKKWEYHFDKVFTPLHNQEFIFEEISQLVQSALDGYKVCIFAYGQTGSGKTYTMEGPGKTFNGLHESAGMIPRSVAKIFAHALKLKAFHWRFKFSATYLEIYNETIRDLLSKKQGTKFEIVQRNKKKKHLFEVPGLKIVEVKTATDVFPLLHQAQKNRSTASTDCNDVSSRSHSLFQLYLTGFNAESKQTVHGVLNLIDLAGSERLKSSNSKGQRLLETKAINKSLSNLGDVIVALASKQTHVPYRNSVLTKLLMNYLGGDSKTLMFVNLCPDSARWEESLCSLRFAAKVNACDIGTARRTVT